MNTLNTPHFAALISGPRRRWRAALVCLIVLCGCVADGTDFEALPFYREDRTEPEHVSIDVPPLLLTIDTHPSTYRKSLEEREEEAKERGEEVEEGRDYTVRFPYPFGLFRKVGAYRSWTMTGFLLGENTTSAGPVGRAVSSEPGVSDDLVTTFKGGTVDGGLGSLPFVFSSTSVDHNDLPDTEGEKLDNDISLWPLFALGYGDNAEEDDYFAMFPFGGVTKGILGKEKITWLGFPYPIYAKVKDRAYDSTHILFPFINWVSGPQNSGFRVLPFFGHYERTGIRGNPIYERTYIMWPFISWSRSGLNEEKPTETLFIAPFFGRQTGPEQDSTTILWPFFRYTEFYDGEGKDDGWLLYAPFPFLQIESGPERLRFDIWPLFGVKTRPGFTRHFVLWPLWHYEDMDLVDKSFNGLWALPVFWRTRWDYKDTGQSETRARLYPLLHYRSYKDGGMDVGGLSPWWWDDAGFERTFGAFMRVYRYTRDRDGGTEHQALFGLFSYRDLPAVPERKKSAYSRLSLLFGLFQYRNLGGEKGLRFLWLLPEITWGEREGTS